MEGRRGEVRWVGRNGTLHWQDGHGRRRPFSPPPFVPLPLSLKMSTLRKLESTLDSTDTPRPKTRLNSRRGGQRRRRRRAAATTATARRSGREGARARRCREEEGDPPPPPVEFAIVHVGLWVCGAGAPSSPFSLLPSRNRIQYNPNPTYPALDNPP